MIRALEANNPPIPVGLALGLTPRRRRAFDKPQLEIHARQDDGGWLLRTYGPGEKAALSALGCELDVDRVYARVFPPPEG